MAGSIRIPAANCGVAGLKPSYGLVPTRGHIPGPPGTLASPDMAVIGPMGRSADDLALGLDVLAGPDEALGRAWRLSLPEPRRGSLRDYRIGAWLDEPEAPVADEVRSVLDSALAGLRAASATIDVTARPVDFGESDALFVQTLGGAVSNMQPAEAVEFFAAVAAGADPHDTTPLTQWARAVTQPVREWQFARERRASLRAQWAAFFTSYDVLLCPVSAVAPLPLDDNPEPALRTMTVNGEERPYLSQMQWTGLATVAELPAAVVPVGLTADGLPIAVQIIAPYLEDRTAVDVARHVEAVFGRVSPPET
jgi:amidase